MNSFVPHIYTFILPLFIGNAIHMLIVKRNLVGSLAKPLSVHLFGSGKTYRAFAVMPLICGLASLLLRSAVLLEPDHYRSFMIGFVLGVVYLLGELPNSFIKRRLGIGAGQAHVRYKTIQYVIDKMDSLVPLCIVYYFITDISIRMTILLFGVSFSIHVLFSWLLLKAGIKKSF